MKEKGVIRHLDTLGRVVIPKEFRSHFGIENGDSVEIFNTNYGILIKKYKMDEDVFDLLEGILDNMEKGPSENKVHDIREHVKEIRSILS